MCSMQLRFCVFPALHNGLYFKTFTGKPFCKKTPIFLHRNYKTLHIFISTYLLHFIFYHLYPMLQSKCIYILQSLKHDLFASHTSRVFVPSAWHALDVSPPGKFLTFQSSIQRPLIVFCFLFFWFVY